MNKLSLIFLVCAVLAATMAQPVAEKTEESTPEIVEGRALERPSVGDIVNRASVAARLTFKDEREAISRATQQISKAFREAAKAGIETAKTGLDFFLILPNFGRNILIDTDKINAELALP